MPPKHEWKPVLIKEEFTISGGRLPKSHVLAITTMQFNNADVKLVPVSSADTWLCEVVTGQVCSRRPLSRSGVFTLLRNLVAPAVVGDVVDAGDANDKMQDLAFDDSEGTPPNDEPAGKRVKRNRVVQKYAGAIVKRVDVPVNPCDVPAVAGNNGGAAVAATRQLVAAVHCKKLLIEKDALAWLVHYLRVEYEAGSVPHPKHDDVEEIDNGGVVVQAKSPNLWWDFRDDCWVGRFGGGSKTTPRKSKSVRSRMGDAGDLAHMAFADAKKVAYDELFAILSSGGEPCVEQEAAVAAGGQ